MFSTAYIRYAREDGEEKNKWQSKTLKCILVGTSSTSDGLLFYHPPSKQLITCGDGYKLDTFSPAGPQFEEKYDGGFIFNTKGDEHHFHRPPSRELSETKYIIKHNIYTPVKILNQPIDEERESYIVQEDESGDIIEVEGENIFDTDPTADPTTSTTSIPFPHHHWIKHQAKATLFLNDRMKTPKQGKLIQNNNDHLQCRHFAEGKMFTGSKEGETLPCFSYLYNMMASGQAHQISYAALPAALTAESNKRKREEEDDPSASAFTDVLLEKLLKLEKLQTQM